MERVLYALVCSTQPQSICICNANATVLRRCALPKYCPLTVPMQNTNINIMKHNTTHHHQPAEQQANKLHRSCATAGPHHVRTALRYTPTRDANERIGMRRRTTRARASTSVSSLLSRVITYFLFHCLRIVGRIFLLFPLQVPLGLFHPHSVRPHKAVNYLKTFSLLRASSSCYLPLSTSGLEQP